jgi:hypothetical protein
LLPAFPFFPFSFCGLPYLPSHFNFCRPSSVRPFIIRCLLSAFPSYCPSFLSSSSHSRIPSILLSDI